MNMKNTIYRILVLVTALAFAAACDYDDAAPVSLVELGATQKEFIIDEDGGTIKIVPSSKGDVLLAIWDGNK